MQAGCTNIHIQAEFPTGLTKPFEFLHVHVLGLTTPKTKLSVLKLGVKSQDVGITMYHVKGKACTYQNTIYVNLHYSTLILTLAVCLVSVGGEGQ